MRWIPKLNIRNFTYPDNPDVGKLKIVYYNSDIKKYIWIQCRYGKRQTYEEAYKKIKAKRESLLEELTETYNNKKSRKL